MSIILAIETSTQQCSVALIKEGKYYHQSVMEERSHSRVLLPMIVEILKSANCNIDELSALAVTYGPGTFTGLRIGLGVIKGLALGHDLPIYGASSLAIVAYDLLKKHPKKSHFISLLDARMGELYAGYYQRSQNDLLVKIKPDELIPVNSHLDASHCVIGGTGTSLLTEISLIQQKNEIAVLSYPSANVLLDYVMRHQEKLTIKTANTISPIYLRNKIV